MRFRNTFATLALSSLVVGCGGDIADPEAPAATQEFTSKEAFLEWVAGAAAEEKFDDLYVARDAKGVIQGVTFTGSQNRDRIVEKLGGAKGRLKIGGEEVLASTFRAEPNKPASPAGTGGEIDTTSQALTSGVSSSVTRCSGSFCTTNSSVNTHIEIPGIKLGYHEVGGSTANASGGWQNYTYFPATAYGRNCGNGPDRRTDCSYDRGGLVCTCTSCSNGDPLTYGPSGRGSAWMCTHTGGWNSLSATVTYFGETQRCTGNICPQVPIAIGVERAQGSNVPSVGRTRTAYGRFILGCPWNPVEACDIKGAVTNHWATGAGGGGAVTAQTAAGRYDTNMSSQ